MFRGCVGRGRGHSGELVLLTSSLVDALGHSPPSSRPERGERMGELSPRVLSYSAKSQVNREGCPPGGMWPLVWGHTQRGHGWVLTRRVL